MRTVIGNPLLAFGTDCAGGRPETILRSSTGAGAGHRGRASDAEFGRCAECLSQRQPRHVSEQHSIVERRRKRRVRQVHREPAFTGKPVLPTNSGSGLFVFTKDTARQYAAWQFLRFAASQRGFTIITSMIGYVPQRDDVLNDTNYLQPVAAKHPNSLPPFMQIANIEMALNWPGRNSIQAQTVYDTAVENVVYGGQDAKQVMDEAVSTLGARLDLQVRPIRGRSTKNGR